MCAALLASLVSLAGCNSGSRTKPSQVLSQPSSAQPSPGFASPRDDLNREVKLSAPARRVLVIGPGADETIFALGAGARIVGRDSGADYPPAITKVPVVADFHGPFIEACVAARPDLVLAQGETWNSERIEAWQTKIGAPVAALVPVKVDDVQKDADKIAAWLGVAKRSLNLDPSLSDAQRGAAPTAFIEIERSPLWTAGANTLISDVVERGHFKNVAADVAGYKAFSKEALLKRQPSLYIATGKAGQEARIVAELRRDPALGSLNCVRGGQVLVIPGDDLLRPGPRLSLGLGALRKARSRLDAGWNTLRK